MPSQPIRVAVIGTSFASAVQIPGFQTLPDVEVVAVASASEERAQLTAERFGIQHAYSDWQKMLDEVDCDLVSIVTPPYLHHEMALATIAKGRHVFCEKPFASNVGQGVEMVQAAVKSGLVHGVDHEFRYRPARSRFKELVDAGHLGQPRVIRWGWMTGMLATPGAREWSWWTERSKGGGILGALGSHLIDSLLWWFGDIVEVTAQVNTFITERPLPGGQESRPVTADDDVALLLRFANGARCSVDLTGMARPGKLSLEAYGSDGALAIEEDQTLLAAGPSGGWEAQEIPSRLVRSVSGDPRLAPFVELAERMMTRIRGGEAPDFADFSQGLRVQAVMDAIHLSADEKRAVAVEVPAV